MVVTGRYPSTAASTRRPYGPGLRRHRYLNGVRAARRSRSSRTRSSPAIVELAGDALLGYRTAATTSASAVIHTWIIGLTGRPVHHGPPARSCARVARPRQPWSVRRQGARHLRCNCQSMGGWIDQLKAVAGRGYTCVDQAIPLGQHQGLGCNRGSAWRPHARSPSTTARSRRTSASCPPPGTARRRTPRTNGAIEQAMIGAPFDERPRPGVSAQDRLTTATDRRRRRGSAYRPVLRPVHRVRDPLENGGEDLKRISLFSCSRRCAVARLRRRRLRELRSSRWIHRRHGLMCRLSPCPHLVLDVTFGRRRPTG